MEVSEEEGYIVLNKDETARYYSEMLAEEDTFDNLILQELRKRNMGAMVQIFLYDGTHVNMDFGEYY